MTAAAAAAVPAAARAALAAELAGLALPSIWLATLGTVAGRPDELVLAAVVDAELLAVHAAVHDALAGRVKGPVAAYLPGSLAAALRAGHRAPGRGVRRAAPGHPGPAPGSTRRRRRLERGVLDPCRPDYRLAWSHGRCEDQCD